IGISRVENSTARAGLTTVSRLFGDIEKQAVDIIGTAPQIFMASVAADAIVDDAELLQAEVTGLYQFFTETRGQHLASPLMGYGLLLVILVLMGLYGIEVIRHSRIAERK